MPEPGAGRQPLCSRTPSRRPGAALALANVGYAALAGFVVLALKSRDIDGGAAVFTAFAVAVFASRLVLSHVPDRAGARPTATVGRAARGGRADGDRRRPTRWASRCSGR